MAYGKNRKKVKDRDGDQFVLIPWVVMDSKKFKELPNTAKVLLLYMARQIGPYNNGQLLASTKYMRKHYEWNSSDVLFRAKKRLVQDGFIYETVKGRRPNRASWYGVTWLPLTRHPDYDAGAQQGFVRSAYAKNEPLCPARPL